MAYVVGKPGQKIIRDGKTVELVVGEPFPEAASYPTFRPLLNTGCVVWVPDESAIVANVPAASLAHAQNKVVKGK